jgi:hypothetical protein
MLQNGHRKLARPKPHFGRETNSIEADWNSFNVGEFLFPQKRASLLPLLLITGGLSAWLLRAAARHDRAAAT